jgi:phage shock protein A
MFYIGNSHYAERMIRRMNQLEREVEDLRANYTTLKASYMYESKQSQVAKRARKLGLEESATPPYKIIVPTNE